MEQSNAKNTFDCSLAVADFRRRRTRGQGTLEYVLMTALLSGVTFAFVKVIGKNVFGEGLKDLPGKASRCLSHTSDSRSTCVDE